jgi:YesN/AraC family two-component response regulator
MGTTPTDYVIRRRILRAQILLSTSSNSVKQIAADLGFANASYFGRMFNKVTGMPPMAFKRQNM